MKALTYRGVGDLRVEHRDPPSPDAGETLVRVEACGICGTDLRIADGHHRAYAGEPRRVPGHEAVGTVAAVGAGADARVGERVFVAPNIGCAECAECVRGRPNLCTDLQAVGVTRDGALAEYLLLPATASSGGNLLAVPVDVDAASLTLVEPLACVLRGQRPLSVSAGDVVLVVGAGPIGLLHVMAAKLRDPARLIVAARSAARRAAASVAGADVVVDPTVDDVAKVVADHSVSGRGADVVVAAVPTAAAQRQALEVAAPGGRVSFFAGLPRDSSSVTVDTNLVHYKELLVTGTTANTATDCAEALDLVRSGRLDTGVLVGARFPLDRADEAFAAARSGRHPKVVIEPHA